MLLNLRNVSLSFSEQTLLENIDFQVEAGERVCLVGRNGAGKSTLMKIIADEIAVDEGERETINHLRISRLVQDVPQDIFGSVFDVVCDGLPTGVALQKYHQAIERGVDAEKLLALQQELEQSGGWESKVQIDSVISRMDLDPDAQFEKLSGGLKRRVMLARALVSEPHLLLLDEPTNHLDIEAVSWLESFLRQAPFALVFITHDRAFLDRIATRIVEVDRSKLYSWPGNYSEYRKRKLAALESEKKSNQEFDKKLAEEEIWVRQGVKARTTRNMGRVRELEEMRKVADGRRKHQERREISAQFGEASGKRIVQAYNINYDITSADGQTKQLVNQFSIKIQRGQTIGIMGRNGCGKTTLIRLLMGLLEPDSGTIKQGMNIQLAYFDQTRTALDLERTAAWNINEGSDRVEFNGNNIHIYGYLRAFLFTVDRAKTAVKKLSGGERNRLLLAKLFAQPSNVLVLDEPTNDLDVETLELLEKLVQNYPGTVLLVSHDRAFINNVVDSMIVHDAEKNNFDYYVGNYDDYLRQKKAQDKKHTGNAHSSSAGKTASQVGANSQASAKNTTSVSQPEQKPKRLSFKLKHELEQLPAKIEQLENELASIQAVMADGDFYQQDADKIKVTSDRLAEVTAELDSSYERWEQLEAGEIS